MIHRIGKKLLFAGVLGATILVSQSFVQQGPAKGPHDDTPKNLKILPKDISDKELHRIMKDYSRSLGVHCNHCHAIAKDAPKSDRPELDFASDEKPAKDAAREMMLMTADINSKYLPKIGSGSDKEQVTCVTCHMGHEKPLLDVNLLPEKEH